MWIGNVIGDRFVVERAIATGGMGSIFRALDRANGNRVALKVIDSAEEEPRRRFRNEAQVLSELHHPAIVRYVAHGITPYEQPYLAMEWLEGEDLAHRLKDRPLTLDDTLTLVRRIAEGLACAHSRGIVHRDLKPSNVFLCEMSPASAKLLDFGIARLGLKATTLTQMGSLIGTIGYMAPEQARGAPDVDARADIFALGCVLYQCLAGTPPFAGEDAVAILAKVIRDDPASLGELRSDLPSGLGSLVARMLSKDPALRPADADAVITELDAISVPGSSSRASARPTHPPSLTGEEQRIATVMLISPTAEIAGFTGEGTLVSARSAAEISRLSVTLKQSGADIAELADGTVLVSCAARGNAVDTLSHIASAGLDFQRRADSWRIALATGRTDSTGRSQLGAVIDRAASLLRREPRTLDQSTLVAAEASGASALPADDCIIVDDVTATLLSGRFEIEQRSDSGLAKITRIKQSGLTLLGKPTPLVGRERELALLEATLSECLNEAVARTVIVTGAAGIGKSRLAYEFLRRADGRARVLSVRADPVAPGSAFLLARRLVRAGAGLLDAHTDADRAARLDHHLGRYFDGEARIRIGTFLCELLGIPSPKEIASELSSAHDEPRIMAEWLRRSFEEWLCAEIEDSPLVVVLDDLHWGDDPSVAMIAEAARRSANRAFMVLGLARSDGPGASHLWPNRERLSLEIEPLTKKASERIVVAAAGEKLRPDQVTAIVARADGNPFFLEELIRAAAHGPVEGLPESILAVVEARLSLLEPEARRTLRAASIFGESFWAGAVGRLLSGTDGQARSEWLSVLTDRELIEPNEPSRFATEPEYRFRHGLVRDAAYAMLTQADRQNGHRLAGEWLEEMGATDSLVIAEHFSVGGESERAVAHFVRAAEAACRAGNLEGAQGLARRGIEAGASEEARGLLRSIQAWAMTWTGEWTRARSLSTEALELLPRDSSAWFRSATTFFYSASSLGEAPARMAVIEPLLASEPTAGASYGEAMLLLSSACFELGERELSMRFLRRLDAHDPTRSDTSVAAWSGVVRAHHDLRMDRPGAAVQRVLGARTTFERLGDTVGRTMASFYQSAVLLELGQITEAETAARAVLDLSQRHGLPQMWRWGALNLAAAKLLSQQLAPALELLEPLTVVADQLISQNARMLVASARRSADPEAEARALLEGPCVPNVHASAHVMLARLALRHGRHRDALEHADRGIALHEALGASCRVASTLYLLAITALDRLGEVAAARRRLESARDRIRRIAAGLPSQALASSYLEAVDVNARTLRLVVE